MIDVDDGQHQVAAVSVGGFDAGFQMLVEGLAVRQIGQGVRHGVAAHLLQVLTQPGDLAGRGVEALLEVGVLLLHLAGRRGQAVDDGAQALGRSGAFHVGRGAGQHLAVLRLVLVRLGDGGGDAGQFAVQHPAGVANFFRQAAARQVLRRQHVGHGLGEGFAGGQDAADLLTQRALRLAEVVQPQLEIDRRRPDARGFHLVQHAPREAIGLRTAQGRFYDLGHAFPRILGSPSLAPEA